VVCRLVQPGVPHDRGLRPGQHPGTARERRARDARRFAPLSRVLV